MSEIFGCDDKDTLVAYLYSELDADGRREVERHLRTCAACAHEVEGLRAVRQDLAGVVAARAGARIHHRAKTCRSDCAVALVGCCRAGVGAVGRRGAGGRSRRRRGQPSSAL